jgi:phosphate transport system permease protein
MNELVFRGIIWCIAVLVFFALGAVFFDVFRLGLQGLNLNFLTQPPENSGRSGGIWPILVSTFSILLIALAFTIPLGLACSVWLSEFVEKKHPLARLSHVGLDALSGVPSIVFGLFGNAFFSQYLGLGFSLFAGGLTLACMALPLFIKTTVLGLLTLDSDWRRQSASLGIRKTTLIWNVLLPAATPAIIAGMILAIGRAISEVAALIFTSGYVDRMPESLFDSGRSLSVHIYDLTMNVTGGDKAAYSSALTLTILIVMINIAVLWVSQRWQKGGAFKP